MHDAIDFRTVFKQGRRIQQAPFALYWRAGESGARLGVVAGRGVGGAVARNRAKRLARECFRLRQHDLPSGDYIVRIVRPLATWSKKDLGYTLAALFKRVRS